MSSEPKAVGIAGTMPGTSGFTMACFDAAAVPAGSPLYDEQALSALRAEVEALRRAVETIAPRFRSGNSIKVGGAYVPREEWEALLAAMEQSA